jgi:hypothetical protein
MRRALLVSLVAVVAACGEGQTVVEQPTSSVPATTTTTSLILTGTTPTPATVPSTTVPSGEEPGLEDAWTEIEAERHVTNFLAALAAGVYEQAAFSALNNGIEVDGQDRHETPAEFFERMCAAGSCAGPYAVSADGPGLTNPSSFQASSTVTVTHIDSGQAATILLGTFEGQLIIPDLPPLVPSAGSPTLVESLFGDDIPRRVVVQRFDAFEIWEDGASEWVTHWLAEDVYQIEGDLLVGAGVVVDLRDPRMKYEGECARLMTRGNEVLCHDGFDSDDWDMFEVISGEPRPTPIPFKEEGDSYEEFVWFTERGGTVVHGLGDAEGAFTTLSTLERVDVLGDGYAGYTALSTDGALFAYVDHRDPASISHFWSPVVVVKDTSTGAELGRWTLDNPVLCLEFAEDWLVACETDRDVADSINEQIALVAINVETGEINRVETPTRIFLPS